MGMPRALAVVGALLSAATTGIVLVTLTALGAPALSRMPPCLTSGPVPGLSAAQAENARIVVGTATGEGGHQAALISLMGRPRRVRPAGPGANPNDPSGVGLPTKAWCLRPRLARAVPATGIVGHRGPNA